MKFIYTKQDKKEPIKPTIFIKAQADYNDADYVYAEIKVSKEKFEKETYKIIDAIKKYPCVAEYIAETNEFNDLFWFDCPDESEVHTIEILSIILVEDNQIFNVKWEN